MIKEIVIDGITYVPKETKQLPPSDCKVLSVKNIKGEVFCVEDSAKDTWWMDEKQYTINTIERICDKHKFSIGDFVLDSNSKSFAISKIWLSDGQYWIDANNSMPVAAAKKVIMPPQPLFITHDDEPIYKGDTYYIVVIEDVYNPPYSIVKINNAEEPPYGHNINFKTKEQAEQWLVLNKPCLSVNDIVVLWSLGNAATDTITKLAKSKING